jgi:hypothetical protein
MSKIAKADREAMNSLTAGEITRISKGKIAADANTDAFSDHKEYVAIVENVLSEDKKEAFSPNDELKD